MRSRIGGTKRRSYPVEAGARHFQPAWDFAEAFDRTTGASLPNAVEIRKSLYDETVDARKQGIL
jgi:hypothetical protein